MLGLNPGIGEQTIVKTGASPLSAQDIYRARRADDVEDKGPSALGSGRAGVFVSSAVMEIVLLLGAVVGLVWLIVIVRAGGMLGGCLLTLLTGIVFGSEFFSVGPVHAGRLMLMGLAGGYLLLRKNGQTDPKHVTRIDVVFGCFLAFLIFSTFTHDYTFRDGRPVSRLLFFNLLPAVMYWIVRNIEAGPKAVYGTFIAVAAFGVYLSLTAIAEKTGQYGLVFPGFIGSLEYEEFLGRGRGPLLNPSANGILICAGWFALLMVWPHVQRVGKVTIISVSLVFAAGVFCTMTRCVWLGAGLGLGAIGLLSFPRRISSLLVVATMVCAVIAGPFLIQKASRFKRDKHVSADEMASSASLRPMLAYVAWQIFREHPVAGHGYAQYKNFDKYYLGDRSVEMPLEDLRAYHQHNIFLSLLSEVGLLGASLFTVTICGWLLYAKRLWSSRGIPLEIRQMGLFYIAFMLSYLCNGVFQDVTIMTMVSMVLFFFSGLTLGCYVKYTTAPGVADVSTLAQRIIRQQTADAA